jgi:hypothetical protein
MTTLVIIRGEHYLTLQGVAESFQIEVEWVQEVYDFGLLGSGERVGGTVAISARLLDRVAEIRRMNRIQGVNLAGIALVLRDAEAAP